MKILYVERSRNEYVSIEKAFRKIASSLGTKYNPEFQQLPFGLKPLDTIKNLFFFRKGFADIYHITGHVNYIALKFSPANTVLTMHDLRFLRSRSKIRRYILKKLYLDIPVRRLRYITAVSENTKQEIIANTNCDPQKIRVLDIPLLTERLQKPAKRFNKSNPVLLQVGTMPNKNLENLISAVAGLECTLKIVGKLSREQNRQLTDCDVNFENVDFLSDEEMFREYQNADIITFCSTIEGFGLPIIEGQAAGKPVITSNLSPMIETSGGAACLVDPHDVENIRKGVKSVINNDKYRNDLIEAGFTNVDRFQPELIVKQYERLYDEIYADLSGGQK